jgi:aldehyde:ferredoxin oxidoreductase
LLDNKGITKDELSKLVSDYYKLRGWEEKGIPKEQSR